MTEAARAMGNFNLMSKYARATFRPAAAPPKKKNPPGRGRGLSPAAPVRGLPGREPAPRAGVLDGARIMTYP